MLNVDVNRRDTILSLLEYNRLHPLVKGGKKPLLKEWQNLDATIDRIRHWFAQGLNFGLITDRVAVLDFDDKEVPEPLQMGEDTEDDATEDTEESVEDEEIVEDE